MISDARGGMIDESPGKLQAALRVITETLARELAQPSSTAPDWTPDEWTLARAVTVLHGIPQLLIGAYGGAAPRQFTAFLESQRFHIQNRHRRIERLLAGIHERAVAAGIAVTPLKGAALHALGVYSPGDRPMADVDLLVRPGDVPVATTMLEAFGYRAGLTSWKEQLFTPCDSRVPSRFGEHTDNDVKIELHHRICERLPLRCTDISERIHPVSARPGLNPYASQGALMLHLLLHAAGSMAFQGLRLVQLHDIALLAPRLSPLDWRETLDATSRADRPWWAAPPLRLVARYFPGRLPDPVARAIERHCPWFLGRWSRRKTLTDVSCSHARIDAFPGIEWAQSPGEAMRFVLSRLHPSREHRKLRAATVETQAWSSASAFTSMTQGRRMVSWLFKRQSRATTLYAVRAAAAWVP